MKNILLLITLTLSVAAQASCPSKASAFADPKFVGTEDNLIAECNSILQSSEHIPGTVDFCVYSGTNPRTQSPYFSYFSADHTPWTMSGFHFENNYGGTLAKVKFAHANGVYTGSGIQQCGWAHKDCGKDVLEYDSNKGRLSVMRYSLVTGFPFPERWGDPVGEIFGCTNVRSF